VPILFLEKGGVMGYSEKLSVNEILDEISLKIMLPIRAAHKLMDYGSEDGDPALAESLLFITLEHWDKLSGEISDACYPKRREIKKQTVA
jgi:hypothetical protein